MATAKLFLDTRTAKTADAVATVRIAVNHKGTSAALTTEVRVTAAQWDAKNFRVKAHEEKDRLNKLLRERLLAVQNMVAKIGASEEGQAMSASTMVKMVRDQLKGVKKAATLPSPPDAKERKKAEKAKENPNSVERFFERYIERKCQKDSTRSLYRSTWRRIVAWLGEKKAKKLEFSQINYKWLEDFDAFLAQTAPKPNGRRPHMSNLKAVINYAMDYEVVDKNPFRRFPIKTKHTEPNPLTVEQMRMVMFAELEPWMEKYRDFFVLSFLMRGTNTVDLCHMSAPVDGRVKWARSKTDIKFDVKIEPEAQYIIDKYKGTDLMLDICQEGRPYRYFNGKLTKALHKIRAYINAHRKGGVEVPHFTMYSARYTWATVAYEIDIAYDIVDVGLAHTMKSMAERYIKRTADKIDTANRRVLDYMLYGKDYREPEPQPAPKKRGRPKKVA